jgi:hypothetical protein
MTSYKHSSFHPKNEDNYILPRKVRDNSSKAFNAQGDVSEPFKEGTSNSYSSVKEISYDTHH